MEFDSLIKKKKIDLIGKDLTDADLTVITSVLQQSTILEELNLMLNKITLTYHP